MARITKADNAPRDIDRVSLASGTYELPIETDDPRLIAEAEGVSFLQVEGNVTEQEAAEATIDLNNPRENPAADHLSASAAPEAIEAARHNDALLTGSADQEQLADTREVPSIADGLAETFESLGIDEAPALPFPDAQEAPAAVATPPRRDTVSEPRPDLVDASSNQDGDDE